MKEKLKAETIEEFLARGGKIQKIDPQPTPNSTEKVRSTAKTPVNLMSLGEGEIAFAEKKKRRKKKKELDLTDIDLDLLPAELAGVFKSEDNDDKKGS